MSEERSSTVGYYTAGVDRGKGVDYTASMQVGKVAHIQAHMEKQVENAKSKWAGTLLFENGKIEQLAAEWTSVGWKNAETPAAATQSGKHWKLVEELLEEHHDLADHATVVRLVKDAWRNTCGDRFDPEVVKATPKVAAESSRENDKLRSSEVELAFSRGLRGRKAYRQLGVMANQSTQLVRAIGTREEPYHLFYPGMKGANERSYYNARKWAVAMDLGLVDLAARLRPYVSLVSAGVNCIVASGDRLIYCERPKVYADGDRLHREDGPAVEWQETGQYYLNGIRVNRQIVRSPERQTIEQIQREKNSDARAIRIERFGWPRYLKESGAKLVDTRRNDVEGTMEALYETDQAYDQRLDRDGFFGASNAWRITQKHARRLVATCPTGRVFSMGVPAEVKTCEQAQNYLAGESLTAKTNCLFRT